MRRLLAVGAVVLAGLAGGCASGGASNTPAKMAAGGDHKACCHAECLVCKYNADLACIDVEVDKTTPTQEYGGKTYYFCSDTCAKKFQKDPAKYVNQK